MISAITSPTPAHAPTMQAGRVDVELTPEDFAAGFYFYHTGQLSKNGAPVDVSELPSQQGASNADAQVGNGLPGTQAEFNEARYGISDLMKRNAYTGKTLAGIAESKGWVLDREATRRNGGRPTYRTPEGTYRAVDRTYGQFEAHDQRGRHQGQESVDGELDTD